MSVQHQVTARTPGTPPVKVNCAQCLRETSHQLLADVEDYVSVDDWYQAYANYQIVQCRGCDHVSFRLVESNSEDVDVNEQGEWYPRESIQFFPPLVAGRASLRDAHLLPYPIDHIYAETHKALAFNQPVLAAIGIRLLIETICKEKGAAGKNLMQQIDALVTLGVLTQDGAAILHMLRDLGNDAAHDAKIFPPEKLKTAFDVVEHLLQGVYLIPSKAKTVLKDTK